MSQYNKTVLTRAGLELAKKANAGQAKFGITRAVTSADDWSGKTTQDLEEVTAIPNIMQQGTIMDAEEVESNNSVIGVSLRFTNKDLSTGYQIRVIGLYVKEEGQDKDFLYAVTTAVTPEYMPGFGDKVLYRFNMQMYLVIGKAQAVNVVIDEGTAVTHGQFDKYKGELNQDLEKIKDAHKEDMSHVVKSASINGGAEILPNETGKLELVVPDPDLSKYVSLEQLGELLKTKADITAIPNKTDTEEGIKQAKAMAQEADAKAQTALDNKADKTTVEENLATKANQSDLDQTNAEVAKKANSEDVTKQINSKTTGTIITDYDIASKNPTKETNSYTNKWLVDQNVLSQFADAINSINSTRVPLVNGSGDDDLFAFKTNQIRLYPSNGKNCKNLPPASNTQWFTVQYVFENPNGDGVAIFRSPANEVWMVGNNGGSYTTGWTRLANSGDISNLQNIINRQNQTIQSLTTRLTNAENEIRYIKANYVEGRTFPASQEAQANSWENENPQRIAFITK